MGQLWGGERQEEGRGRAVPWVEWPGKGGRSETGQILTPTPNLHGPDPGHSRAPRLLSAGAPMGQTEL